MGVASRLWYRLANWLGRFVEETAFRVALAARILLGRVPLRTERRVWDRDVEAPVLVNCYDWTNERLIFSILAWPPLEVERPASFAAHDARVEEVIDAIARGAAEKAWSTRWHVDDGLTWDRERKVWVAGDGFATGEFSSEADSGADSEVGVA